MTIILFVLIFGIVVLSHEFGHFIIAKKNGIHVIEFSIGMGPTILHVDKKGTRYSIKLLPFGGACMFEGMDGMEEAQEKESEGSLRDKLGQSGDRKNGDSLTESRGQSGRGKAGDSLRESRGQSGRGKAGDSLTESRGQSGREKAGDSQRESREQSGRGKAGDSQREKSEQLRKKEAVRDFEQELNENYGGSFLEAGVWARIATIFAGPFFNLVLGFIIALILVGFSGTDLPVVQSIMEGSAAQEAGIEAGDTILKVNGETIHVYREVSLLSALNKNGQSMTIEYLHDGVVQNTVLTPKYSEADSRYYIGLAGGGEYIKCSGLQVLQYGFYESEYIVKSTIRSIQMLVTGKLSRNDVSGPVGIANYVGETYNEVKEYGIPTVVLTMMDLVLILSINLGIMNLLPLPALDGGRLVFLFIELVRGKPVPPEKEGMVHFAGLILFFALMIFVMYNDIMNLIH